MQRIPFQSDSFLESSPSSGGIFRDAVARGLFCSCEEHLTINPVIHIHQFFGLPTWTFVLLLLLCVLDLLNGTSKCLCWIIPGNVSDNKAVLTIVYLWL